MLQGFTRKDLSSYSKMDAWMDRWMCMNLCVYVYAHVGMRMFSCGCMHVFVNVSMRTCMYRYAKNGLVYPSVRTRAQYLWANDAL